MTVYFYVICRMCRSNGKLENDGTQYLQWLVQ